MDSTEHLTAENWADNARVSAIVAKGEFSRLLESVVSFAITEATNEATRHIFSLTKRSLDRDEIEPAIQSAVHEAVSESLSHIIETVSKSAADAKMAAKKAKEAAEREEDPRMSSCDVKFAAAASSDAIVVNAIASALKECTESLTE